MRIVRTLGPLPTLRWVDVVLVLSRKRLEVGLRLGARHEDFATGTARVMPDPVLPAETALWNGEPASADRVKVLVPRHSWPQWLTVDASPLRHAVRVEQDGHRFFIDNEDGSGWAKVTDGRGSPRYGHRSLPDGCAVSSGDSDWEPSRRRRE